MDTNNVTNLGCPGAPASPTATPAAAGLPVTGGAPLESGGFTWPTVLIASVMGCLGAAVVVLSVLRSRAPMHNRHK